MSGASQCLAYLGLPGDRRVVAERGGGGVWIAVLDRAESVLLSLDEFRLLAEEVGAAFADLEPLPPETGDLFSEPPPKPARRQ